MTKYVLKAIVVQLIMMLAYLAICSYFFVISEDGNPIQFGIIEWLLMISQFMLTAIIGLVSIAKAKDTRIAKKRLLVNLLIVVLLICLSLSFNGLLSKWLWSFRKDVIQ